MAVHASLLLESANWRDQAECRSTDPALFFPVGTTGMALEQIGGAEDPAADHELHDMQRRFWVSTILTLPVFLLAMGDLIPGRPLEGLLSARAVSWISLVLTTPVW